MTLDSTVQNTSPISLAQLCNDNRPDHQLVAIGDDRNITWLQFKQQVFAWQHAIEATNHQCFGLYFNSAIDFSAALIALWNCGKQALIAGDTLPATMQNILPEVDALIGDFPDQSNCDHLFCAPSAIDIIAAPSNSIPLQRHDIAAIIFTSGSTGAPQKVPVCLFQLDDEIALHENQWGKTLLKSPIITTVSHHHLYGLLFRLLWPLATARVFINTQCRYLEEIRSYAEQFDQLALVTTPSHLNRIPPTMPWPQLRGKWSAVFSSTAPLPLSASQDGQEKFGVTVTEIFGSSETGGIAWRQQTQTDVWQTLPGIRVDADTTNDGALLLSSPLIADQGWLQTADKIELLDHNHFRLLGRIDRIVKVEGKRLSLTAMENRLQEHDHIAQAKAIIVDGHRKEVAVAALLTPSGRVKLETNGRRLFNLDLKQHLKSQFEAPVLPRKWRYPHQLPENAQGKVTQQLLAQLFADTKQ